MGQHGNLILGIFVGANLGPALPDKWHNLRPDIVTKREESRFLFACF